MCRKVRLWIGWAERTVRMDSYDLPNRHRQDRRPGNVQGVVINHSAEHILPYIGSVAYPPVFPDCVEDIPYIGSIAYPLYSRFILSALLYRIGRVLRGSRRTLSSPNPDSQKKYTSTVFPVFGESIFLRHFTLVGSIFRSHF